jgi:hypothetical protein
MRVEWIGVIAENHGVTLPEYVALDVASIVVARREVAADVIGKILRTAGGDDAIESCLSKKWLQILPNGLLKLTLDGATTKDKISREVHQLPR